MLFSQRTLDQKMKLARYERLASNEDLDRWPDGQELADYQDELDEFGKGDQDGATLSASDWEDARAGM